MWVVVVVIMVMVMTMAVLMVMVMSINAHRIFSGQSASAFLAHQSTSSEVSSISRPARSFPLG
jgi:preprotein translocase subunit SecG